MTIYCRIFPIGPHEKSVQNIKNREGKYIEIRSSLASIGKKLNTI